MIRQCSILFGCMALGELVVYLTADVVFRYHSGTVLAYSDSHIGKYGFSVGSNRLGSSNSSQIWIF